MDYSTTSEPGKIMIEGNKIKIGTSVGSVYLDIVSYDSHKNKNAIEIFSSDDEGVHLE